MDPEFSKTVEVTVPGEPEAVFAALDDPLLLGRHMTKPSAMTLGGSMRYELDAGAGRRPGSIIRAEGSVLGLRLSLVQRVTERDPPRRKAWETVGDPQLLVLGRYRLSFDIAPAGSGSRLRLAIRYDLPRGGLARVLGRLAAHAYANWCLRRMAEEARRQPAAL